MTATTLPAGTTRMASARTRRLAIALGVFAVVCIVAASLGGEVPTWLDAHVQPWARDTYRWTVENSGRHWMFTRVFDPIRTVIDHAVDAVDWVLRALHWTGVLTLFAVIGWKTGGPRAAAAGALAMAGVGVLGVWDQAMLTLALMTVSVSIALMIGIPLGVWTARSDHAEKWMRPVLDTAQVLPTFVYLVPLVVMFRIQNPPAVIATVIYAVPPAVRLTNLGLRQVPLVANEVGLSFGCTTWQHLTKVQLPMARRTILLGLNQVIMMAFGIVVIASLVGTNDLGRLVLDGLQKNDVGQAFVPGLAIVLVAVALDRITTGERSSTARQSRVALPTVDPRVARLAPIAAVLVAAMIGKVAGADSFPSSLTIDIKDSVNDAVDWVQSHVRRGVPVIGGTESINDFLVADVLEPLRQFLVWLPWLMVVAAFGFIGWLSSGWRLAMLCTACLIGIGAMGTVPVGSDGSTPLWDLAMDTLSQVMVAIAIAVLIAVPLGIWAGRSDRVNALLRPFLDVAQVMPQFVYLIPVIFLFQVGRASGVVASVIYAVPPCIRLTSLGLREVPITPREAAISFGATPRQELVKVQLPMATRSILLGINQTILMVLATVIIAALVGSGALGLQALNALANPLRRIGQGLAGGLSIVLLAVVLDRITQSWGTRSRHT
jgi:glycine betaine/proline transport system permease protein